MTLRNLNQSFARGRVLGTPKTGVLGALIPATGDLGPAYAYNSLALPADAGKEICGYVTTMPSAGTFEASEDTAFTFSGAPDGTYTFLFQMQEEGVDVGTPRTGTLNQGAAGTTINCTVGNAAASGLNATITQSGVTTISCSVGNAAAGGATATVTQYGNVTISCTTGNASAVCPSAQISNGGNLAGTIEFRRLRTKPTRVLRLA